MKTPSLLMAALLIAASLLITQSATAQTTAFTYQGRLTDGPNPATGYYDVKFSAWTNLNGPVQVGSSTTNLMIVTSNGFFTTVVDFGSNVFTGLDLWLELGVRTNGGGAFNILLPRQRVSPTPYAIHASAASKLAGALPSGQLSGPYTNSVILNSPANVFAGNGSALTGVNAATLGGLGSAAFWQLGGNAGTIPGTHFLGTTDNQPLEIKVNGTRGLRLEPTPSGSPNLIGGAANNSAGGYSGVAISGGGASATPNVAIGNYAAIGGGMSNQAAFHATVAGGSSNQANLGFTTVGGGTRNRIGVNFSEDSVSGSTIGGGVGNLIDYQTYCTIAGGASNIISGGFMTSSSIGGGAFNDMIETSYAAIGGGYSNLLWSSSRSVIGGGERNSMNDGYRSVISGGSDNFVISAWNSVVGGGTSNAMYASHAFIGGGERNRVSPLAPHSAIGGGTSNWILNTSPYAVIAGGRANSVLAAGSTISGGGNNLVHGTDSVIGGGTQNIISNVVNFTTIAGGAYNQIVSSSTSYAVFGSTIGGGVANRIVSGMWSASIPTANSTVGGGTSNTIWVMNSVIAGGVQNEIGNTATGSQGPESGHVIGGGERNRIGYDVWGATIGGGINNYLDACCATIAGGEMNYISWNGHGSRHSIGGGKENRISSFGASVIGGGSANTNNGDFGVIAGGDRNQVQGDYASVGGGTENAVTAAYGTVPGGIRAKASNHGQMAYASGQFTSTGDAQTSVMICRGTTTNATQKELFLDGATQRMGMPTNSTWAFDILVTARSTNFNSGAYQIRGAIENNNGIAAIVGATPTETIVTEVGAWQISVFETNNCLGIRATGSANNVVRWVAQVRTVEVSH